MQPLEAASNLGKVTRIEHGPAPLSGTSATPISKPRANYCLGDDDTLAPLVEHEPSWLHFAACVAVLAAIIAGYVWALS